MKQPRYVSVLLCASLLPMIATSNSASLSSSSRPHFFSNKKRASKVTRIKSFVKGNFKTTKKKRVDKFTSDVILYQTKNLLAGLASAIALIPEASTFAMTAGLSPLVGLGSTVIMATCSGCLGGRPGLVSGASATVSMILKPLSEQQGHLSVSLAVILAGIIQIGLGLTRCGRYIRVVPRPVMLGFVNGLAIKVMRAQIPHFQHPHGVWLRGDALKWHSILVVASALIIELLPKMIKGSIIPSPLVALGLAAVSSEYFNLPVPTLIDIVGPEAFQGGLGTLLQAMFPFSSPVTESGHSTLLPPFRKILTLERIFATLPTAAEMAVVGLLQTLLTLQIVDERTHTKGKSTKESVAQGLGNVLSGSIGGMGGSALLGQSLVNVNAGGTGRLSSIAVAIFVLAGVTLFAPILGVIPVGSLVGLMLTVAQHTFSWAALKDILKGHVPLVDVIIMVGVTLTTSFINMAAAVALGVLASALRFAWQASCNMSSRESGKGTKLQHRYIRIRGPLFFGSALVFQKLCEPSERDREVAAKFQARCALAAKKREEKEETFPFLATGRETIIDFSESQVWDHAAIMAIEAVCKEYHKLGVILRLRYLSPDCREKLLEGSDVNEWSTEVDVDIALDPSYLVGEDPKNKF